MDPAAIAAGFDLAGAGALVTDATRGIGRAAVEALGRAQLAGYATVEDCGDLIAWMVTRLSSWSGQPISADEIHRLQRL